MSTHKKVKARHAAGQLEDARLTKLLGSAEPAPRKDFTVAAINYPGFHPTPLMESWYGFGWSEWDLATRCRPRFKGHRQPLECLWGPYDESDPAWTARETDAAADHGIDAWIYDWYWYSGVEIWNEGLNRGFLHAPNRKRMKFGVMWANHTWTNNHPAPLSGALPVFLPIRHSPEDLDRVVDYWCERYFCQSNYWRIGGKPWCSFFLLSSLMDHLGGQAGVAKGIERMRRRAQAGGEKDLYMGVFTWSPEEARIAREVGFDHATSYNVANSRRAKPSQALVDYRDVMEEHVLRWQSVAGGGLPYWPVVTQGWDVSARNHPYEPWPPVRWGWPWGHIVTGNTPSRMGQLVRAARRFLSTQQSKPKVVVLNAWNEWTEGSVLAPTKDEGWAVLKALKAALNK
jgi:hypothetical protein